VSKYDVIRGFGYFGRIAGLERKIFYLIIQHKIREEEITHQNNMKRESKVIISSGNSGVQRSPRG
jgi:hypothetical protein